MDILNETYGNAAGYIDLVEGKTQKIKEHLEKGFPTIRKIRVALQKSNPDETQYIVDKLISFITDKKTPFSSKRLTHLEK